MARKLLLISNSTNAGEEYLAWPRGYIQDFLNSFSVKSILFIPWAGVNLVSESVEKSFDIYEERVKKIFSELGFRLNSIHREPDRLKAVNEAESVVVGGGNTFHLVAMMHQYGVMDAIHDKILGGSPFIGWSAGANVACPTMKTTNDMPICEPSSFQCLGLVPFQINPHYLDAGPAGHAGETREQRIQEFLTVNRGTTVAGLREGCLFHVDNDSLKLRGKRSLRIFQFGLGPREYTCDENLDFLLKVTAG